MSASHGFGQRRGHLSGWGIFSQVTLGWEVPREVLSWSKYILERSRGKAAEANGQKYCRAKPNHSQGTDREEQTQVGRRSPTGLAAAKSRSRSGRRKVEKAAVAADKSAEVAALLGTFCPALRRQWQLQETVFWIALIHC